MNNHVPLRKPDDPCMKRLIALSNADMPLIVLLGNPSECQSLAMDLAHYTERTFEMLIAGDTDAITDIYGFEATDGSYVPSPLVRAAESGGIFYIHCADLCNPTLIASLKNLIDFHKYRKGMKASRRYPPVYPLVRPPAVVCEQNYSVELDEGHDINSNLRCVASVIDIGALDPGLLDRAFVLDVSKS